jgi:hypothetical protein
MFTCYNCLKLINDVDLNYIENNRSLLKIYPTFLCFCKKINYVCIKCKKTYKNYKNLKNHLIICINNEINFICEFILNYKQKNKKRKASVGLNEDIVYDEGIDFIEEKKDDVYVNYFEYIKQNVYSNKKIDFTKFKASDEDLKNYEKINYFKI